MANEKRLIDVYEAKRRIIAFATGCHSEVLTVDSVIMMLNQSDTVDAVEVVHGQWRKTYTCSGERLWGYECDQCKADNPRASYYCPNCGAKMDGGNEDGLHCSERTT